jgi:hypothetical protein
MSCTGENKTRLFLEPFCRYINERATIVLHIQAWGKHGRQSSSSTQKEERMLWVQARREPDGQRSRCEKRHFLRRLYIKTPSFCQDRLGTNIHWKKHSKKSGVFRRPVDRSAHAVHEVRARRPSFNFWNFSPLLRWLRHLTSGTPFRCDCSALMHAGARRSSSVG